MTAEKRKNCEAGLTLVEILASLVILCIVFVAFMTIFPQMTLFNSRTETKLETMNEARVVLEEMKGMSIHSPEIDKAVCPQPTNIPEESQWFTYEEGSAGKDTKKIVLVKKCPDVVPADKGAAGVVKLHQIRILIEKNSKVISESFGYVQVDL